MKRKIILAILTAALMSGMATGCGGGNSNNSGNTDSNAVDTGGGSAEQSGTAGEEPKVAAVQLSSIDYPFEKEYMFGDFNDHSRKDVPRQGVGTGVDTFNDTEIVFEDMDYDQLIKLLEQEGNYLIQFSGSWCHNSRGLSPYVNEYAKEYGIDTIYMYDFMLDNSDDGSTFVRMTNGRDNIGVKYNYMYGEIIADYLDNINDWVEYTADSDPAITYTNAEGQDVAVARLQQPFLFLYNKDNTADNSGAGNESAKRPIVYAFEEMVDRDAEGVYVNTYDAEGKEVPDADGNVVRTYITDEYKERLKKIFDFIKDNDVKLSEYTKADYVRDASDSLKTADRANIYMVTYRQMKWLLEQDGGVSIAMFGNPSSRDTQAMIAKVNEYATANNVNVYLFNNVMDNNYGTDVRGYSGRESTDIFNSNSPLYIMCTRFLDNYLTNIDATDIQSPYLFAYSKSAVDKDGFAAPVIVSCKDENGIADVFKSYADYAGIEMAEISK